MDTNSNNTNSNDPTKNVILSLEVLSKEYDVVLIQYNQAQQNYINFIKSESNTPCSKYNPDSTGIDQPCYDDIWKKAGCSTTGVVKANTSWSLSQTLNGLIEDSFAWATMTDPTHRNGCYGVNGNPYTIIGIGTDGLLYSRPGLDGAWVKISDNSSNIRSICTMNDGVGLLCSNSDNNILQKTDYTSNWSEPIQNSCCVLSVAMGQDGTIIGIGTDNTLFTKPSLDSETWTHTPSSDGEWVSSICIAPDGSIFCVGGDSHIWKKNSYTSLTTESWIDQGETSCCVKAITITTDGTLIGVGTDNRLYSKTNYKDMTEAWTGPHDDYNDSCCVIGITTITDESYDASLFNTSSEVNYDLTSTTFTSVKGSTFLGTGSLKESDATTVEECQAMCSSDSKCSGATFNVDKQYCMTRTGEGPVIPGTTGDYAIIPAKVKLLSIVKKLNEKLSDINKKILYQVSNGDPLYSQQSTERREQAVKLEKNYQSLKDERDKIEQIIKDEGDLIKSQELGNIYISQKYSLFIMLSVIAIIIIFLVFKFGSPNTNVTNIQQGGSVLSKKVHILIFIMMLITLVTLKFIKK